MSRNPIDVARGMVATALVLVVVLGGLPATAHTSGCEGQIPMSGRVAHCSFESTGGTAYVEALTANGSVLMECVISYDGCLVSAPHPATMVMSVQLDGPNGFLAFCNTASMPVRCDGSGDASTTAGATLQCTARLEDRRQNSVVDVTAVASFRCSTRD